MNTNCDEIYRMIEDVLIRMKRRGVEKMNDAEYDVCSFVSELIPDERKLIIFNSDISIQEACFHALCLFSSYGSDVVSKIEALIRSSTFKVIPVSQDEMQVTGFSTIIDTSSLDSDGNYGINRICFPNKLERFSPIYLGHELVHAAKDINPSEYQYMLRYADVLPIFFELISADLVGGDLKKIIIKNRLALLASSKKLLKRYVDSGNANLILDLNNSKACQYLNSFYYSILLYLVYVENPVDVLKNIKKVLLCESNTYELIQNYDFLNRCGDNDVKYFIKSITNK